LVTRVLYVEIGNKNSWFTPPLVKGHQDNEGRKEKLDKWVKGKILADVNVKHKLQRHKRAEETIMMKGESWRFFMNQTPIAGNSEQAVQLMLAEPTIKKR